jgi:hypothetical protein
MAEDAVESAGAKAPAFTISIQQIIAEREPNLLRSDLNLRLNGVWLNTAYPSAAA